MDNLETELDRLYALEPAAFVAERDKLVRELREAGRREESDQVKQLRKPTLSAWAINRLTREERRAVDLLLDAGHRLREAQQDLLAGKAAGSLDEARRNERTALADLSKAAQRILAEAGRGNDSTLNRIMSTLQVAVVSDEGRELLARGRLTGDLEATGFDLLAPLPKGRRQGRTQERKATRAAPPKQREQRGKRLEEARRRLRGAQAAAKAAEKSVREAERDAGKARRQLEQAEERLQKRQAAASQARIAVDGAEKRLREEERKAR
jgi:hypothetical protein